MCEKSRTKIFYPIVQKPEYYVEFWIKKHNCKKRCIISNIFIMTKECYYVNIMLLIIINTMFLRKGKNYCMSYKV